MKLLWIGLGGFVGALARYGVSSWLMGVTGIFPLGTLAVNLVGCALMGFGAAWFQGQPWASEALRAGVFVGVLGAFTTFSTFGFEVVQFVENDNPAGATLYVAISVALGVLAVWGGQRLAGVI